MGTTPLKAIRAKCLDCCCGSYLEVTECPIEKCPLYCYRLGKDPARAGHKGNPHLGEIAAARAATRRENKEVMQ